MPAPRLLARLTVDPIDPSVHLREVGDPGHGAIVLFLGTVRGTNQGRSVEWIDYHAFEPMARSLLEAVLEEASDQFGIERAAVVHRLGKIGVGEISIALALSSPHRAEAFEAVRWMMDRIKRTVPIWKKESFEDGGSDWVAGADPREGDGRPPVIASLAGSPGTGPAEPKP